MLKVYRQLSQPSVVQGFSTRDGGVSSGSYDSLNVSYSVGDTPENVDENRRRLGQNLALPLLSSAQVHGDRIYVHGKEMAGDRELSGYDGLLTDCRGVGLMIQQADCQAVCLYDPQRPAVGIVHAGWRGSVLGIVAKAVRRMVTVFNSRPQDILAAISPSLGPCCAEFINYQKELPVSYYRFQVRPTYFDFWAITRWQLQAAGIQEQHIIQAGRCTCCDGDFFSYRRNHLTGRSATIIGLTGTSP